MTLKVVPFLDPRSEAAKNSKEELVFATSPESEAFRQLLRDYLAGRREGLSLLVSGHRGAGKTTLVWNTIRQVEKEWERGEGNGRFRERPVRFLKISLDGPNLFPERDGEGEAVTGGCANSGTAGVGTNPSSGDSVDGQASDEDDPEKGDDATTLFLRRVVSTLYQDLSDFFAESMRDLVTSRESRLKRAGIEAREMAGYFELELDTGPLPDVLRDYWSRLDVLEDGILFQDDGSSIQGTRHRSDQGIREILALSTAAIAYQKVIGKLKQKRDTAAEQSAQRTVEIDKIEPAKGGKVGKSSSGATVIALPGGGNLGGVIKELTTPLLGLLAGAMGGAAFLSSSTPKDGEPYVIAMQAAAIVIGAALAMMFGAKVVTKRTQTRTRKDSSILEIDTRAQTLARDLPRIVGRLKRAGLLPIFVVDELDKVPDIDGYMKAVMRHIKGLVNEEAYFVFLTDRTYYDYLRWVDKNSPYAREVTYFRTRLFVAYRPADMWRFLLSTVKQDRGDDEGDEALSAEEDDRVALTFFIMQRSRMHPFSVRGELSHLTDSEGVVRLDVGPGEMLSRPRYLVNILMQIAILLALRQNEELFTRMREDAYFVQQIYDAAFYPARRWSEGDDQLNVGMAAFESYMRKRANPREDEEPEGEDSTDLELTPSDCRLLHKMMQEIVRYVSEPEVMCDEWDDLDQYGTRIDSQSEDGSGSTGSGSGEEARRDTRFQLIPQVPGHIVEVIRSRFETDAVLLEPRRVLQDAVDKNLVDDTRLQAVIGAKDIYLWRINDFGGQMRGDTIDRIEQVLGRLGTQQELVERIDQTTRRLTAIEEFFGTL